MKTSFLFPNSFKKIGWLLFIPSAIYLLYILIIDDNFKFNFLDVKVFAIYFSGFFNNSGFFKIIQNNIGDELYIIGLILGAIFIVFSKTKEEDEMISKIRYESLVWATYLNYSLIIIFTLFFYGIGYYSILMYNTFTILIFFLIRFHFKIYQLNKALSNDE